MKPRAKLVRATREESLAGVEHSGTQRGRTIFEVNTFAVGRRGSDDGGEGHRRSKYGGIGRGLEGVGRGGRNDACISGRDSDFPDRACIQDTIVTWGR